jgi:hypothetical protein
MASTVNPSNIHQGPGVLWLGVAVPGMGDRLTIDVNGNPTGTGVVTPPGSPALSSAAGGTLSSTTYYVEITLVSPTGETTPSAEVSLEVAADNELLVQSPPPTPGAIGWNGYIASATGQEKLQNSTPIPIGVNWTQTTALSTSTASPPSTNSTTALYGGAIQGATTFGIVPKIAEIKADQIFGAIDARPTDAEATIEATLLETDLQKLSFLLAGASYLTGTDTTLPAGFQSFEQLTYGGLYQITKWPVAVISPRVNYPGKFVVSQLYNAYVGKDPSLEFSKEKPTTAKVTFSGIAIPTRAMGDQLGTIWRQL